MTHRAVKMGVPDVAASLIAGAERTAELPEQAGSTPRCLLLTRVNLTPSHSFVLLGVPSDQLMEEGKFKPSLQFSLQGFLEPSRSGLLGADRRDKQREAAAEDKRKETPPTGGTFKQQMHFSAQREGRQERAEDPQAVTQEVKAPRAPCLSRVLF
ncbi:hypothetical protein HJG60_011576 [Phyllostomus discolor]|uniref:Uncharacterized protein n=1 Tax=Phyllostomus discolor TaxID=89673 RepID=A0A833ZYA9_9CHIR|nr:hypothetical protein HJG60_011576 [Phyllostomus discolor]